MIRNHRTLYLVAAALVVTGVVAVIGVTPAPTPGPTADTTRVARGDLVEVASVSGTIEPDMQVDVHSRIAGEVVEVLVEAGDVVESGVTLFRLDPTDTQLRLRAAEAEVARARAALAEARAQLSVSETSLRHATQTARLSDRGVDLGLSAPETARESARDRDVAKDEVALRKAQVASAVAQLEAARVSVEDAQRNLERTEIKAPFAGTVLSVGVEKGTIISSPMSNVSGGTTLVTLADLTDLRVIGQLDEAQIGRVKVDQPVTFRVDAYPERTFEGHVHRVSPLGTVDTNVVVFDVEIVVTDPAPNLLRSGMSADVEVVTTHLQDVLLVPLTAIRSKGTLREVELPDGSRRALKTGATDGTHIVVLEGLEEGDEILADGRRGASAKSEAPRSGLLPGPPRRSKK